MSDLAHLKERAAKAETPALRVPVAMDQDTYEQVVCFVEQERCSVREALRRAVRLGVQVLLADRHSVPVTDVVYQVSESAHDPGLTAAQYAEAFNLRSAAPTDAAPVFDSSEQPDWSKKAPPGL